MLNSTIIKTRDEEFYLFLFRHGTLRELLDHLLGVDRLAERDHVPGVPHHQHVEVVRLGDVSNNIPGCPVFVDGPLCVPED